MLDENKGTCCHRCGHVHVKGTSCPTPFLKGERSCERRSLNEAGLTDHYRKRKAQRGTILDIEIPQAAIGDRNLKDVKSKLIPILQAKLDQRLSHVESMELGASNNVNLGLVVFVPVIAVGEKSLPIKMVSGNGSGYYYLVIAANNALLTMYPGSKKTAELENDVEYHVKRERPDDVRPPKAEMLSGYVFKIDIDGNEVRDVEKKPEIEKASEDTLEYKVRTDYRVGATFDHNQFGPGKIVAADKGGKAGPDGRIDWIDVKYTKPFMKGGKLQDVRRFNNILTAAYFGKTMKEAGEEVKCKECGWHWKLLDGGKDPYICHKCGHDNTPKDVSVVKKINAMDEIGPIERFVMENQSKRQIKEERTGISPQVQAFLDECNRIIGILRDDELFEKERQKHKNGSPN
jgi:hypothetical protein